MKQAAYGTWPSPIDADLVVSAAKGYGGLRTVAEALFWIESRPEEGGRCTLIQRAGGATRELTPAPFDVRSRVHEYGGGAYCVTTDCDQAYFVNFADQNIYAVALAAPAQPRKLTDGDASERFADLAWDGAALLAVRETHGAPDAGAEPVNDLVRVDVESGGVRRLHGGHDFYAAPRPAAGRLAFLAWDHPNMPWDGTQLLVADYHDKSLQNLTVVAGGSAESIAQPEWHGERLLFVSDAGGWWNLYAYDATGVYCLLEDAAEYAEPAWQFGASCYAVVGIDQVLARRVADGVQSLVMVDVAGNLASPVDDGCSSYTDIVRSRGGVAYIAGFPDRPRQIIELALDTRVRTTIAAPHLEPGGAPSAGGESPVAVDVISTAEPITFPSTAGDAHALFYPPRNGSLGGLDGELPPLLVTTHGGPTAAASADLSWRIQFYTSRGWAVADVNYGGSTGYGRAYRERLHGTWGKVDVDDCAACVRHLIAAGRVDPARVAIRGGSAGGYTTLAGLVFTDVFKAGASHYGIGDLRALDRDTHKFESRYVGTLTGGGEVLVERSPINHVHRLNCPVAFFQGADDKIVPPNQAEAMRAALVAKGIPVAYLLFEGEGHGFRRAENVRRVIEAEYGFFARVFGIDDVLVARAPALEGGAR